MNRLKQLVDAESFPRQKKEGSSFNALALVALAILLLAPSAQAIEPVATISGVTAQQRYPWNGKVDIEYTVSGLKAAAEDKELVPTIKVLSVDRTTTPWTTNYADSSCLFVGPSGKKALTDAEATKDGTHQIVWDMDKQGLSFVSTNVIFAVLGEGKKLGGVQLWEGGPYWAECNVGASQPQDCGYYFWWGDIVGYKRNAANDGWDSVDGKTTGFTFAKGNCGTADNDLNSLKNQGWIDTTTCELKPDHDAATKHLGAPWRMPTSDEIQALVDYCSTTWTVNWNGTGVAGYVVTGKGTYASKSIFLPVAGYGNNADLSHPGSYGYYWSSTPNSDFSNYACFLYFSSSDLYRADSRNRYLGQPVRPVRGSAQ